MTSFSMEGVLAAIGTHKYQAVIMIVSALTYAHFSMQSMLATLSTTSMLEDWDWLADDRYTYNLVFALGAFARLAGSLFLLPWIDIVGRRPFIVFCLCLSTVMGVASAFAPNYPVYVVLRCAVLGLTSVLPSAATIYSLEMVFTRRRALPAMLCQTVAVLYIIYATFLIEGLESSKGLENAWRWAAAVVQIPTLFAIAGMLWLWLETPRFVATNQGNPTGAWRILCKLCPKGEQGLLERLDISSIPETFEGHVTSDRQQKSWCTLVLDNFIHMGKFVVSKSYRRNTLGVILLTALQSFAHWGMSSYLTLFYTYIGVNRAWTTAGSFAIQLPGQVLIYWFMQRHGRLPAIRYAAIGAGIALLTLAFSLMGSEDSWARSPGWLTAISLLGYFFGGPIWGAIYAFSAESYPTMHRGSAMSVFGAVTSLSVVVTTYVGSASLNEDKPWIFPLIWGGLRFVTALCSWIPPEDTSKKGLDDHQLNGETPEK